MPQFGNTPKCQSDFAQMRRLRMNTQLPVGTIAESVDFSYGYDGNSYWVAEGALNHKVTRAHLTQNEARMLYDALNWNAQPANDAKIRKAIYSARKKKYHGQTLFWHFVDTI